MLTITESAKELDLSVKRVYKLVSDGRIAAQERFGRLLISRTEIKRFKRLPRPNGRPRSNGTRKSK